jgi:hypothetical protein
MSICVLKYKGELHCLTKLPKSGEAVDTVVHYHILSSIITRAVTIFVGVKKSSPNLRSEADLDIL